MKVKTNFEKNLEGKKLNWIIRVKGMVFRELLTYDELLEKYSGQNIIAKCITF